MNIILIPYRNRGEHLKYFIKETYPLLKKEMKELKIVVVEQTEGKLFNRGKLLNIGFMLYKNTGEYFFNHDVDLNPKMITIKELYKKEIEDGEIMGIYTSRCNTLGGIIKFKKKVFIEINGFPNEIWGWGTEDKALQNRAEYKRAKVTKNILDNDPEKDKYFTIFDDVDDRVKTNEGINWYKSYKLYDRLSDDEKRKDLMVDGLNNLTFKIEKIENINDDIKKITVNI